MSTNLNTTGMKWLTGDCKTSNQKCQICVLQTELGGFDISYMVAMIHSSQIQTEEQIIQAVKWEVSAMTQYKWDFRNLLINQ